MKIKLSKKYGIRAVIRFRSTNGYGRYLKMVPTIKLFGKAETFIDDYTCLVDEFCFLFIRFSFKQVMFAKDLEAIEKRNIPVKWS